MATIDIVIEFPDGTTDVMVYNNGKDVKSVVVSIRESCLLTGGSLQKAKRLKLKYTRITNAAEVLDASMIYKFTDAKMIDGTTADPNNTAMRRISVMIKGLDYRLNNPELERAGMETDKASADKKVKARARDEKTKDPNGAQGAHNTLSSHNLFQSARHVAYWAAE